MELALPLGTALLLGALHAFEPDHLAAVTALTVRRPTPRAAAHFGIRWAAGHGLVIAVLGTILVVFGLHFPSSAEHWLERGVGVVLVALGSWTVAGGRALHAHIHSHADGTSHVHVHSHLMGEGHEHGHAVTLIGALHGLAGTAPAVALLALTRLESAWTAVAYLLLFGIGTMAGMGLYALLAGAVAGRAALRSVRWARAFATVTGVATVAVGLFWLLR